MLYAVSEWVEPSSEPFTESVRYRTVGDMTITGAVRSSATVVADVISEIAATRVTERGETRADDRTSEAAMEDRKRQGYFSMTVSDGTQRTSSAGTGKQLLRLATAGSVDDGKSTLIGRLLLDAKLILQDTLDALHRNGSDGAPDLASITDGLRAEREQGITIDVAYRYFTTPRRSFIIADTPGHERYTRNMVTGASTAQLAVILIDARHGIIEQSRRHACLSALLGIRHMVAAVNKMDLVDWDEDRFREIEGEFAALARAARRARRARRSRSRRSTATTSSSAARPTGTTGRRCSSTSSRSTSPPTAAPARCGCRCSGSSGPRTARAASAATPARSPAARCAPATRSSCCRPARARP